MRITDKTAAAERAANQSNSNELCPIVEETLLDWSKEGFLSKSHLFELLSTADFGDLEDLKSSILSSAELWELQQACVASIRAEKPWALEEAVKFRGGLDPFRQNTMTHPMVKWIAEFKDLKEFREHLEKCLKTLPISMLQAAITDRTPKSEDEALMVAAEKRHLRGLERVAKARRKHVCRYAIQPLSSLPRGIEKSAKEAGVLDAFRPMQFNHVSKKNLDDLNNLKSKFPNASIAIDLVHDQFFRNWQFGNDCMQMRPIILSGEPGVGKTRLCREIAEVLNVDVTIRSVAGHADANIFGVSAGWSTAMPSIITRAVCASGVLNPLVMIDELDKVLPSQNGSVWSELLGLLEKNEAQTFYERFLSANVDASHICWLFTANDLSKLPRPLVSRCLVVQVDNPSIEQVPQIIRSLKADYASELGVDERMLGMTSEDHDWLVSTWLKHGSIRILSELLRNLVDGSQMNFARA